MKKHGIFITLSILAALAMLGQGPCEDPEMDDSIEPQSKFLAQLLHQESVIAIYESPTYFIGQRIDPTSIDRTTVKVTRVSDGQMPYGQAAGFDTEPCLIGGSTHCPLGVTFTPGSGLNPCDLDGDTAYDLIISGLTLDDGSTISTIVVRFYTFPVPAGYTPVDCSPWLLIDDLDPQDGLTGGVAGAVSLIVAGVMDNDTIYFGYDMIDESTRKFGSYPVPGSYNPIAHTLFSPPYIPVLEIFNNTFGPLDLATTAQSVWIVDDTGYPVNVALPAYVIPSFETLPLYVGRDGSTYYAGDEAQLGPGVYSFDFTFNACYDLGGGLTFCPVIKPHVALANGPAATW